MILFRHIFRIAPQALALFPFKDCAGGNGATNFENKTLRKHAVKVVDHGRHRRWELLKKLDKLIPVFVNPARST